MPDPGKPSVKKSPAANEVKSLGREILNRYFSDDVHVEVNVEEHEESQPPAGTQRRRKVQVSVRRGKNGAPAGNK
jgi:hypothetical protein